MHPTFRVLIALAIATASFSAHATGGVRLDWWVEAQRQETVQGRGLTFEIYYWDGMHLAEDRPPEADATGNPGQTLGEQHRFLVRRALQRFADELVSVVPLSVVTFDSLGDDCDQFDRPSIHATGDRFGKFDPLPEDPYWVNDPTFEWLYPPEGMETGVLYPLAAMVARMGREGLIATLYPDVETTADIELVTRTSTGYGFCGSSPTFWLGVGDPPPGRVSYEATLMQAIAEELGLKPRYGGTNAPAAWGDPNTIIGTPVQMRYLRNEATQTWYRDATPSEATTWLHQGSVIQFQAPRLVEAAAEAGVLARLGTPGVPAFAEPPRFLHWYAEVAAMGFNPAQRRWTRFAASVAPADVFVDRVDASPEWGIELTLALLEDLGYVRYRYVPPPPACEAEGSCVFVDGFEG